MKQNSSSDRFFRFRIIRSQNWFSIVGNDRRSEILASKSNSFAVLGAKDRQVEHHNDIGQFWVATGFAIMASFKNGDLSLEIRTAIFG